ncbi:MAG: chromosome segregation protein SMC [Bacteroidota bacterium]
MNDQNLDNSEKQGSKKILLTLFIIALLVLNGILFYLNFKNKDEIDVVQTEKAQVADDLKATSAKLDSISNELDIRIAEVTKLGGDVESLMKVKDQLESDKNSLRSGNRLSAKNYAEKISTYEALLVNKDKEIHHLKNINDQLYSENTNLKNQKNSLNDSINTIEQEKQKLSEQVAVASVLKAENLIINAINSNGKEKEGGEYKARKVEKIKILFNLAENNVAKIESKDIMMRLIEPDGAVLYDTGMGGGTFSVEGKEAYYTAKQEILFDNTKQQIAFTFTKGAAYKQGRHTIELYADGFKIGTGTIVLK